jgi:hypothetical protein
LLSFEQVRESSARDARTADVVMLATARCDRIPLAVAWWLSDWCQARQGRPGGLVLLVPRPAMASVGFAVFQHQLHKLAGEVGMDFLCVPRRCGGSPGRLSLTVPS